MLDLQTRSVFIPPKTGTLNPLPVDSADRGAMIPTTPRRIVLFVASLGISACEAPGGPSTGQPEDRLAQLRPQADSVLRDVGLRVASQLDVAGVIISVIPDRRETIGGYGLGGRTHTATDVRLFIDADFPGLAQVLTPRLAWIAAHELHHVAR
jgi:hypothetical protein